MYILAISKNYIIIAKNSISVLDLGVGTWEQGINIPYKGLKGSRKDLGISTTCLTSIYFNHYAFMYYLLHKFVLPKNKWFIHSTTISSATTLYQAVANSSKRRKSCITYFIRSLIPEVCCY